MEKSVSELLADLNTHITNTSNLVQQLVAKVEHEKQQRQNDQDELAQLKQGVEAAIVLMDGVAGMVPGGLL